MKTPAAPRLAIVLLLGLVLAALLPRGAGAGPSRTIALTYDDLPGVERGARAGGAPLASLRAMNAKVLAAFQAAGAPVIGFVNEDKLQVEGERDARVALLRDWLEAGHTLGNHTFAHRGLTATPLETYQDDVVRGDAVLRALLTPRGTAPAFFRHPFTQTGPTAETKSAFERFLASRGYRVAPFTVEDADYMFAALFDDARARGDAAEAAKVKDAYLAHQETMLGFFEGLSKETFGREIAQIHLVHVNALHAEVDGEALRRMAARGYRFVTLEEALRDEAYATPDLYVGKNGPSWLHRFRVAKKLPDRMPKEPDPPKWVLDAWAKLRR